MTKKPTIPAPTKEALNNYPLTSLVIFAMNQISALLGDGPAALSQDLMAWGFQRPISEIEPEGGYFVILEWSDAGAKMIVNPDSDDDWKRAYMLIGYATYHGIEWEAP